MNKELLCDFCSDPKPPHYVECKTFDVTHVPENVPMTSVEGWWACDTCFALIEQGDRQGLFDRTKAKWIAKYGELDDRIDPYLWEFHQQFWENRKDG